MVRYQAAIISNIISESNLYIYIYNLWYLLHKLNDKSFYKFKFYWKYTVRQFYSVINGNKKNNLKRTNIANKSWGNFFFVISSIIPFTMYHHCVTKTKHSVVRIWFKFTNAENEMIWKNLKYRNNEEVVAIMLILRKIGRKKSKKWKKKRKKNQRKWTNAVKRNLKRSDG